MFPVIITFYTFFYLGDFQGQMLNVHSADPGSSSRGPTIPQLKQLIKDQINLLSIADRHLVKGVQKSIEKDRNQLRKYYFDNDLERVYTGLQRRKESLQRGMTEWKERMSDAEMHLNIYWEILEPDTLEAWRWKHEQARNKLMAMNEEYTKHEELMNKWENPELY